MTSTTRTRRTAALLAPAAVLALGLHTPAGAVELERAHVTASVSDTTPASGQTFRVSGRLTRGEDAVSGRTVKVQTLRGGSWSDLTGARMATSSTGGYSLRLVLGQTGERTLRVVGVVPGRDAIKRFTVRVH